MAGADGPADVGGGADGVGGSSRSAADARRTGQGGEVRPAGREDHRQAGTGQGQHEHQRDQTDSPAAGAGPPPGVRSSRRGHLSSLAGPVAGPARADSVTEEAKGQAVIRPIARWHRAGAGRHRHVGERGDGPVGVRAGVAGTPSGRPRWSAADRTAGATRRTISSSTRLGVADPQVLGAGHADHLGLRDRREAAPGLGRAQVVVELGHQRGHRLAGLAPSAPDPSSSVKRSGGESRIAPARPGRSRTCSTRSVPNDQPSSQTSGSSANSAYSIAAATSNRSPTAAVEGALAGAAHAAACPGC